MTMTVMPQGRQHYFDDTGADAAGFLLYTYAAGTVANKVAYRDAAGTDPHTNPIQLDAKGEAVIFWSGSYKVNLTTPGGASVTGWPVDNLTAPFIPGDLSVPGGAGLLGFTYPTAYSAGTIGRWLKDLALGTGTDFIGWIQNAAGAVLRTVTDKNRDHVNLKDFGAKLDGVTDDLAAWNAAITCISTAGRPKKLVVPYGATGVCKTSGPININTGGITIEFENNTIQLKKTFNGDVFVVRAGKVAFVNPGIDGNGVGGFTGGGIRFGPASQFTFDCVIINPNITNTKDSCLLLEGPRGAAGLQVIGGTMYTYNAGGVSSGGFPSVRVVGPTDADTSDRRFIGVTSSDRPLVDFTGMWLTKVSNCFAGTFIFKGNPDVTGVGAAYASCAEVFIDQTYIRDGMTISGLEVIVDNCLSHGVAPVFGTYGGTPSGSFTYGWAMTSDTIACRIGAGNVVSNGVTDNSPNGHAIENQCSSFGYGKVMVTDWTAAVTNPVLGNGTVLSTYDINYKTINFRVNLVTGSTTTRGSGKWSFALPVWCSMYAPPVGNWVLIRPGMANISGAVFVTASGSTHRVSLSDPNSAGGYIDDLYPASLPTGSQFYIDFSYPRG